MNFFDSSCLPHPKEEIRDALLTAIFVQEMWEQLDAKVIEKEAQVLVTTKTNTLDTTLNEDPDAPISPVVTKAETLVMQVLLDDIFMTGHTWRKSGCSIYTARQFFWPMIQQYFTAATHRLHEIRAGQTVQGFAGIAQHLRTLEEVSENMQGVNEDMTLRNCLRSLLTVNLPSYQEGVGEEPLYPIGLDFEHFVAKVKYDDLETWVQALSAEADQANMERFKLMRVQVDLESAGYFELLAKLPSDSPTEKASYLEMAEILRSNDEDKKNREMLGNSPYRET